MVQCCCSFVHQATSHYDFLQLLKEPTLEIKCADCDSEHLMANERSARGAVCFPRLLFDYDSETELHQTHPAGLQVPPSNKKHV